MTQKCTTHDDCPNEPAVSFTWPWGTQGFACSEHMYVPGQVAGNMARDAPTLTPLTPNDPAQRAHELMGRIEFTFAEMIDVMKRMHSQLAELESLNASARPPEPEPETAPTTDTTNGESVPALPHHSTVTLPTSPAPSVVQQS